MTPPDLADLQVHPVDPGRWRDVERLFGERGATGGCWCMYWRIPRAQFERQKGEGNRRALAAIVRAGDVPGLLAYAGAEPVGWCALGPRERYSVLERSRTLQRVDAAAVWSIVCFFVARGFRHRGVSGRLLEAAAAYARERGAEILEGYPVEPKKAEMPDVFAWTGLAAAFREAGFVEVLRRSETRPIMRRYLEEPPQKGRRSPARAEGRIGPRRGSPATRGRGR